MEFSQLSTFDATIGKNNVVHLFMYGRKELLLYLDKAVGKFTFGEEVSIYPLLAEDGTLRLDVHGREGFIESFVFDRERIYFRSQRIEKPHKPNFYWTPERIEEAARTFYQDHGRISIGFLSQQGRSDLGSAIQKYYPGRVNALKAKIGIAGLNGEVISVEEAREELGKLLES